MPPPPPFSRRACGILLHPTSIPGRSWCGDLGESARRFVDFLQAAGQSYWQTLPLGPPGYRDTPYQALSAIAGNDQLIALEPLAALGLLEVDDSALTGPLSHERRHEALQRAWERLHGAGSGGGGAGFGGAGGGAAAAAASVGRLVEEFQAFCERERAWLDDYALFASLKDAHGGRPWRRWPAPLRRRDPAALASARTLLVREIDFHQFRQWLFRRQWAELRTYARERGIAMIGDAPIFVALDSADAWSHPSLFLLDAESRPLEVAGVPPDYFSADGQLWGNPIYDWEAMRAEGFAWWVARMQATLSLCDAVRLDHFIGFHRNWAVPAHAKTAREGRWISAPGRELLETLRRSLGGLPIIAEDLGFLIDEVRALRDDFGLPGMKVLQFAFSGGPGVENDHLPHTFPPRCIVYTGTHDNDTTVGWWRRKPKSRAATGAATGAATPAPAPADSARAKESREIAREHAFAKAYLGFSGTGRKIHWDLIRCAYASVADTAIVPLQDVLGLGSKARMNKPGVEKGNWQWRYDPSSLSDPLRERLRTLAATYGRVAS